MQGGPSSTGGATTTETVEASASGQQPPSQQQNSQQKQQGGSKEDKQAPPDNGGGESALSLSPFSPLLREACDRFRFFVSQLTQLLFSTSTSLQLPTAAATTATPSSD